MRRLHFIFGIATLAVIAAGLIHGGIAWIVAEATWDPFATSFPTWAAFVLPLLFYAAAALILLLAWGIAWLIARGVRRKRQCE